MAKGGLCEVLFGGGIFEFRPDRLVGMDERTPPQELDRVEYRGDAKRVVVLPKTTFKLIEFDFEGPDRINWASQKCVLGAGRRRIEQRFRSKASDGRYSRYVVGAFRLSHGRCDCFSRSARPRPDNNVAGRTLWVLKQDAQVALIRGGLQSTPYASVLQNWMRACTERTPDCEKGARALERLQRRLHKDRCQWKRADTALASRSLFGVKRCESRWQANDVARARGCEGG